MIARAPSIEVDIPDDPAMPGMAVSAQPQQMLETCRAMLPGASTGDSERWSQCVITEAIYQPGRACRVAYALRDATVGRPSIVYARWPAEARTHVSATRVEGSGTAFDLYRYPRDRRLRQIRTLRRNRWLEQASAEWFAAMHGEGGFAPASWRCTPIKYVPESRLVCRLKGDWCTPTRTKARRAYVRISRSRNILQQRDLLLALDRATHEAVTPLRIARPLAAIQERGLLATEFIRGRNIRDALFTGALSEVIEACGILAGLSRLNVPVGLVPQASSSAAMTRRMVNDLLTNLPALAVHGRTMAAWADTSPPMPTRPGLVHGDLHTGQIIRADEACFVVDWDLGHWGDPTRDITNLAAEIEAAAGFSGQTEQPEKDASECIRSWREAGGSFDSHSAKWWAVRAFVLRAWGLLRHLRPGWRASAQTLLTRAAQVDRGGCEWTA